MVGAVHGGVKFYRGSAAAARAYVEADHSRADDYYLAEGSGLAERYLASPTWVSSAGSLAGDAYERWVAGCDPATGMAKGRLRDDEHALRFVEVVINGPKTWSVAAALDPEIAGAYDAAMDRAAGEIISYVASTATTRVGPRGRQVQVPVEHLEAAVVRHYTSRAGDPHRHLHLQINARVWAAGRWRGLHSVGVVDSIEAINGIGHAAIMCDPAFRQTLAARGYTLDADGEICELAPFAPAFSHRAAQIHRNIDRYEADWRTDHPGQEPGPAQRRTWDRRAWADARPDKVVPADGATLVEWWLDELHDLGFIPPERPVGVALGDMGEIEIGRIRRDAVAEVAVSRLGARRSAWNVADIRGEIERLVARVGVVADPSVRSELVEDLADRATQLCVSLLNRSDVPGHIRNLTSPRVLEVEVDLIDHIVTRSQRPPHPSAAALDLVPGLEDLDPAQRAVASALAGGPKGLVVIEGAAGTGKTTTLAAASQALRADGRRLVVVTPTLKAAQAARDQVGADAFSAAWLIHQHGYRWDEHGRWTHTNATPDPSALLRPGDVLLVDEAGMLDQDTARAIFEIADEAHAGVALLGDRHQLPAVGRGGVLDLAARWAPVHAHHELDAVHRFTDPTYADLSLQIRSGEHPEEVFDTLLARGQVVIHPSDVERTAALATIGARGDDLIVTDTRDQVAALNAAIRDHRRSAQGAPDAGGEIRGETHERSGESITLGGEQVGVGDRIATRRNDRDLGVANRDTWTITATHPDGSLLVTGRAGKRLLPTEYVAQHVELAYATTAYGAQGETVTAAHLALDEATGAASAYVAMTRGRQKNTAHLVATDPDDARRQWVETFARDPADLGPAHATKLAGEAIERYGTKAPDPAGLLQAAILRAAHAAGAPVLTVPHRPTPSRSRGPAR